MIISLIKKETGIEFINKLEKQYGSIEELEKLYKRTGNMKFYIDFENWKYYNNNPEETIEQSETLVTSQLKLTDLDFNILNTIKYENPQSIRELAGLLDKDVSNIQPKVHKLKDEGYIDLIKGKNNRVIPYLNYDEIKIEL